MFYRSRALKAIFAALMGPLREKSLKLPLVSPRGGVRVDSKGLKQAVSSTIGSNQRRLMTGRSQEAKKQTQNIQRDERKEEVTSFISAREVTRSKADVLILELNYKYPPVDRITATPSFLDFLKDYQQVGAFSKLHLNSREHTFSFTLYHETVVITDSLSLRPGRCFSRSHANQRKYILCLERVLFRQMGPKQEALNPASA